MSPLDLSVENVASPSAIEAFVEKLAAAESLNSDRRSSLRQGWIVSVTAVPVDEALRPTGDAFMAITRDISRDGISLIYHEPIAAKYLALDLPAGDDQELRVFVEVLRCRRVGPLFDVAGRFATKAD